MPTMTSVTVPFIRLSNSEVAQFTSTTLKAIEKTKVKLSEHAPVHQCTTKISKALTAFEDALNQDQLVTAKDIAKADKLRTVDTRNILLQVKLAQSSRLDNKKAAANDLATALAPFKNLYQEKYEKKTSLIRTMIARLEKSPYKEKVSLVGAKEWVDNLKLSQEEFYQLYLTYAKNKKKAQTKSIKEQRTELLKDHIALYQYLLGIVALDSKTPLKEVLMAVNDVRLDYAQTIKRRKKKEKALSLPLPETDDLRTA